MHPVLAAYREQVGRLALLSDEAFHEMYDKWMPQREKRLHATVDAAGRPAPVDPEQYAKWVGFYQALEDVACTREWPIADGKEQDIVRVLRYLYEEQETPNATRRD